MTHNFLCFCGEDVVYSDWKLVLLEIDTFIV